MRLRIVRPLPRQIEGVDLGHLRFGAAYDLHAPLYDLLLVEGYGVPVDDPSVDGATSNPAKATGRRPV